MGVEIPVIEGGFGENYRITTAKTISKIHNVKLKEINQSIKRLIDKSRLKENVDYIDLFSSTNLKATASDLGLIYSNGQKSCYILSERGYSKLIKYMDDDQSWDVHDKLIDEYFTMREVIKDTLSLTDIAILKVVKANNIGERMLAMQEYNSTVVKPLKETIEKQKPMVGLAELRIDKKGCYSLTDVTKTLNLKRGAITKWAKTNGYIHKKINEVNIAGEQYFKVYSTDGIHNSIGITNDGLNFIKEHLNEIQPAI